MGEEDRHLLAAPPRVISSLCRIGVGLDLDQVLHARRGQHAEQHHPLVAHRQAGAAPDGAEEVVDGQREVFAWHVGHLPAVDLVHLLEALACAVRPSLTPSWSLRVRHAEARGQVRSARPRPAAGRRRPSRRAPAPGSGPSRPARGCGGTGRTGSCRGASGFMSSRNMIAPARRSCASVWRTTRPERPAGSSPLASASLDRLARGGEADERQHVAGQLHPRSRAGLARVDHQRGPLLERRLDAFVGLVGRRPTIVASSPFLAAPATAADRRVDDVDALRRKLLGQFDGGGVG